MTLVIASIQNKRMESSMKHTDAFPSCQSEKIRELAENADNEYYIAGMATDIERVKRGLVRIELILNEFDTLRKVIECEVCKAQLIRQIALQREGLKEVQAHLKDLEL